MKTALILLVVAVAYVSARTLVEDKTGEVRGLPGVPCKWSDVGNRHSYPFSPSKYFECTKKGWIPAWELKRCEAGTWYNADSQSCVGNEEPETPCEPEAPVSSEEVPEESEEPEESAEPEPEESASHETEESAEPEPEPEESASHETEESAEPEPEESASHETEESAEPEPEESESGEVEPENPASSEEGSVESGEIEPEHPAPSSEEGSVESGEIEPEHPAPSSEEGSVESGEIEPTDAPAPESESWESEEEVPAPSSSEEVPQPSSEEQPAPSSEEGDSGENCAPRCSYHGEYLVNSEDCHSFYQCSWGVPHLHKCPLMDAEGNRLVWDPTIDTCNWPRDYHCTSRPGCQNPDPQPDCPAVTCEYHGQYLANPADCHSFYQCSHGVAYLHQCAMENDSHRLTFNPNLNVCVWSWEYDCSTSC